MSENLINISRNLYVVKTQAGFRKLLKLYGTDKDRMDYVTFPTKYPCTCLIFKWYGGYQYTIVDVLYNEEIKNLIAALNFEVIA